jgi:hypothetical protein
VIATVAAGMLCGNLGARTGMSAATRLASESFWEYVTFALNSIVFLLIGFEVHLLLTGGIAGQVTLVQEGNELHLSPVAELRNATSPHGPHTNLPDSKPRPPDPSSTSV